MKPISETVRRELKLVGLLLLLAGLYQITAWQVSTSQTPCSLGESGVPCTLWFWLIRDNSWLITLGPIIFLIPVGIAIDRFGPFRSFSFLLCVYGIATLLVPLGPHKEARVALDILIELTRIITNAAILPVVIVTLIRGVRADYFARYFLVLFAILTNIVFFRLIVSYIFWGDFQHINTQSDGIRYGVAGFTTAIALWLLFPRSSDQAIWRTIDHSAAARLANLDFMGAIRSRAFWATALVFFLIAVTFQMTQLGWLSLQIPAAYDSNWRAMDMQNPYLAGGVFYGVMIVGYIAGAYFADKISHFDRIFLVYFGVTGTGCFLVATTLLPLKLVFLLVAPVMALAGYVVTIVQYKLLTLVKPIAMIGTVCATMFVVQRIGGMSANYFQGAFRGPNPTDPSMAYYLAGLYAATAICLVALLLIQRSRKYYAPPGG